ncbi:hypothetical protein BST61_g7892 [Cercospora zeina]
MRRRTSSPIEVASRAEVKEEKQKRAVQSAQPSAGSGQGLPHRGFHTLLLITAVTMDARLDRDQYLQQLKSSSRLPQQTWYEWFWGLKPKGGPARPTDAASSEVVKNAFVQMLDQTEPPDVFKPSEVALQLNDAQLAELGYEKWEEVLPAVYELAFEMREFGDCEILRKGRVLPETATIADLDGPIRIRRVAM